MKRKLRIITSAFAASPLAFAALAQETPHPKTGAAEYSPRRFGRAEEAIDTIKMEVKNYHGQKLGKVDDLAIDRETGRIVQVILSTGSSLGIGDIASNIARLESVDNQLGVKRSVLPAATDLVIYRHNQTK